VFLERMWVFLLEKFLPLDASVRASVGSRAIPFARGDRAPNGADGDFVSGWAR
jgi:hypothetical protein